jgi:hypothetical protein
VLEVGLGFLVLDGQRHPQLKSVQRPAARPQVVGAALRVHDAAAGGHPVQLTRADRLLAAQRVAVHAASLEQIGHGAQADVGMRADIEALSRH